MIRNESKLLLAAITIIAIGVVHRVATTSRSKSSIGDPILSQTRHSDLENDILKTVSKTRDIRSVIDQRKNCDTWATWVNEHHPTQSDKVDKEFIPQKTLHDFCPLGNISKFECKDGNGEAFHTNATAGDGKYFISCYNIYVGVTCTVLDQTLKQCPDLSIRYYCSCPIALSSVTVSGTTTTTNTAFPIKLSSKSTSAAPVNTLPALLITTRPVSLDNRTNTDTPVKETTLSLGAFSIPWWAVVLLVTGLFFIFNVCISICLYRKATHRLERVHPSQSV